MTRPHVTGLVPWRYKGLDEYTVYRICHLRYADLDGIGAAESGGRWNQTGQNALYTSFEIGTAAQECFSHIRRREIPVDYALMTIKIKASLLYELDGEASVPSVLHSIKFAGGNLLSLRYDSVDKALRSSLLRTDEIRESIVALFVPSAINPVYNVVLYPDHLRMREVVRIESVETHAFHPNLDRE